MFNLLLGWNKVHEYRCQHWGASERNTERVRLDDIIIIIIIIII
jgi:hypothetical protein